MFVYLIQKENIVIILIRQYDNTNGIYKDCNDFDTVIELL